MHHNDVFRMVRSRASAAAITADIIAYSARASGITTYLENGRQLEAAQGIANRDADAETRLELR